VYCQLEYLSGCLPGRIRQTLDELPDTLDGTYERTLREIKEINWEFAHRLFQCVAVVSRPLLVEELADFLAFDFKAGTIPEFQEDWRLEDPFEAVLVAKIEVGPWAPGQSYHTFHSTVRASARFRS